MAEQNKHKTVEWIDPTRLFAEILVEIAQQDPAVVCVTADSCDVTGKFLARFPERSFDLGVAEQNACGFAAGLALAGKRPFITAIAPFATGRCYEQIRNDVVRTGLPVAIAGRGAGMSYSTGGPTHNAIDDMGLLRVLPGMVIVDPGDLADFRNTMFCAAKLDRPIYFRKHKPLAKCVNPEGYAFRLGQGVVLSEGQDATIIACGSMVYQAMLAAEALAGCGISTGVVNMHTIKPLDTELVRRCARQTHHIITAEEHSIFNGLGSAVADVLAESGVPSRLLRIGLNDEFPGDGPYYELLEYHGLSGPKIAERVFAFLEEADVASCRVSGGGDLTRSRKRQDTAATNSEL